jgi:hypothetical protein
VAKLGFSFVAIATKEKIAEAQWNQYVTRRFSTTSFNSDRFLGILKMLFLFFDKAK